MPRKKLNKNVLQAAVDRMVPIYEAGHRVVVSCSGGKDSTVCVEVCRIAAELTGRLPIDVMMRDEEIMYPGTFEYCERLLARDDINFHWFVAGQPIVNVCSREQPYYWVFDNRLRPEQWMRPYPEWAQRIPEQNIEHIVTLERFPPDPGKQLYNVIGLRASESYMRSLGISSSKGYLTGVSRLGVYKARPIYDWYDGDVWHAIRDNGWDYNKAYDAFYRIGIKTRDLRIAPPALIAKGATLIAASAKLWPHWFDRLAERLPGVRHVAMFGLRALEPLQKKGESWEETFWRECVHEAPDWIAERAVKAMNHVLSGHAHHSSKPFPEIRPCAFCTAKVGSWKMMAKYTYNGDPFCTRLRFLPYVEPEFFREGAGTWGGKPTW